MIKEGRVKSLFALFMAARSVSRLFASSTRITCQPCAANLVGMSSLKVESILPSIVTLFLSYKSLSLPSFYVPANEQAS